MQLRSSSTPILRSWLSNSKDCPILSAESDFRALQRTRSVSFHSPSSIDDRKLIRPLSMADNVGKAIIPSTTSHSLDKQTKQESDGEKEFGSEPRFWSIRRELFSSSGLGDAAGDGEGSGSVMQQTVVMGGGEGNDDGKICGGASGGGESGGGDDGGAGGGSGFFESNSTDVYYQTMIEANPGNSLLLGNYAKFLKEIRADFGRAEEYCGRAILANPDDGNFLSLYADLIWHNQKDIERAKTYFDQAVKTAPNDCYVLASYAKFLWDVEDEEEETEHTYIYFTLQISSFDLLNNTLP
ncbi:uncharacterized protein LOC120175845 isoform X2 [Hibiscus syriacus]|uniref:uncharacterized protein LOC120175845 isoform X2 n=1 Tax=Hibiscus syriacus TaxID=106335 RepID=UPI001922CD5E|nr:uncharacterized protein LOC120175845 isoform X2 [Hibiscus syriacus]